MQRIVVEIKDQYVTQRRFAQAVQIHETTISNIISGALVPSEEQQAVISKGLGVEWDKLIEQV
jgi:transcriptional regulator with XRE-family HTH domain